jgi:branched-subunit amino acid transport protein
LNPTWFPIILVGILTFLSRLSFIILLEKINIRPSYLRAFRYIPIAVLSAIILPEIIHTADSQFESLVPRLIAGLIAIFFAWRTRNIMITIISGMIALFIMQYFLNSIL